MWVCVCFYLIKMCKFVINLFNDYYDLYTIFNDMINDLWYHLRFKGVNIILCQYNI